MQIDVKHLFHREKKNLARGDDGGCRGGGGGAASNSAKLQSESGIGGAKISIWYIGGGGGSFKRRFETSKPPSARSGAAAPTGQLAGARRRARGAAHRARSWVVQSFAAPTEPLAVLWPLLPMGL